MRTLRLCHRRMLHAQHKRFLYPLREKLSYISRAMIAQVFQSEDRRLRTVCFTGHRYLSAREREQLPGVLDQLLDACYRQGYREYLAGGALGFDMCAAEAVERLQSRYSDVKLILVIPCADQSLRWSARDCQRYERLLYAADENRVLSDTYYDGCMMVRNHHMIDHSSLCICYLKRFKGGTASTVAYALKENVKLLNSAMEDACTAFLQSGKIY